ncbi:MAG TPA: UvrD-helicase domain-containing protein [Eubacteriales bacterium]|nr:UvrD-helicase domain-containing protein [Eubacteriales bacterium]
MDLSILNDRQREAVEYAEGPLLVLAGAGSGKTRVLTHRIAYLIEHEGIAPYNILALTFTNKAAREMRERVNSLVSYGASSIWVFTFHGFCARLLSSEIDKLGYKRSYTIYDEQEQLSLIGKIIKDLNINDKDYSKRMLSDIFSKAKNQSLNPVEYLELTFQPREVREAFREYEKRLKDSNALDFDDLLLFTVRIFENFPDVLDYYRDRLRYILVDEYQDTNMPQYRIVELLAKQHRNICVVGDDDQSIYGWRGADIRNILEFEKDFPGAKVVRLEQNYRSTAIILKAANNVISKNSGRKPKTLWTQVTSGPPIEVYQASDERDEASYICSSIASAIRKGARCSDFAILYRTHSQSRVLEMYLKSFGLDYIVYGGISFFARAEVKDVIAYLKLLYNPADNESFYRIINTPKRGIGSKSLEELSENASKRGLPLLAAAMDPEGLSPALIKKLEKLTKVYVEIYTSYGSLPLVKLAERLLELIEYDAYLAEDKKDTYEARKESVVELLSYMLDYEKDFAPIEGDDDDVLASFLKNVALFSSTDSTSAESGTVTLMTLHAAKGLEFDTVFLCGLEAGLFPTSKSLLNPELIEEERRLCYVGVTRAKRRLILSYALRRMRYGSTESSVPSQFLEEMGVMKAAKPKEAMGGASRPYYDGASRAAAPGPTAPFKPTRTKDASNFKTGDRIRHRIFGLGTVASVEGSGSTKLLVICFDNGQSRKFAADFAPITGV